jgi:hypothetical protein
MCRTKGPRRNKYAILAADPSRLAALLLLKYASILGRRALPGGRLDAQDGVLIPAPALSLGIFVPTAGG